MAGETLYLKLDKNMQIKTDHVMLGDIAGISCSTKAIENRVKTLRLPTGQIKGPGRYVFSVLDVIAVVHEVYPELEVTSLGEADFILTVEEEKTWGMAVSWMKTGFVCLLAFFGAAFSIMAFNN
ncbi:MAG: stage V sporulation protein AA, partial [Lachnospiraceae bacterium]